jgi:hypothetical protein
MIENRAAGGILWGFFLFAMGPLTPGTFQAAAQSGFSFQADPGIEVTDNGLFGTFHMFYTNNPIAPGSIETEVPIQDPKFYEKVSRGDEFVYYDEHGVRQVEETKRIWGYRHNGNIYIRLGTTFHKLSYLGRFSWFAASVSADDGLNSSIRKYVYRGSSDPGSGKVTTIYNEYLVDLKNNVYWDFDLEGLELALQEDPVFLMEFKKLNRKKKNRMRYIFLQRLNERHPFTMEGAQYP